VYLPLKKFGVDLLALLQILFTVCVPGGTILVTKIATTTLYEFLYAGVQAGSIGDIIVVEILRGTWLVLNNLTSVGLYRN
jgi:hypothetical protein